MAAMMLMLINFNSNCCGIIVKYISINIIAAILGRYLWFPNFFTPNRTTFHSLADFE